MNNTITLSSKIKFNFGEEDITFDNAVVDSNTKDKLKVNFVDSFFGPAMNIDGPILCHLYEVYDENNNLITNSQFPIIVSLDNNNLFNVNDYYKVRGYYINDNVLYIYESEYTRCSCTNIAIKIENNPRFSILIAINNRPEFLNRTLISIILNKSSNFEIIIVNNAKDIETNEKIYECIDYYIQRYPLLIKYFNIGRETDKSLYVDALNTCINEASGKYCMFMDADDIITNNHLDQVYEFAISNDLDMVTTGIVTYTNKDLYSKRFYDTKNILKNIYDFTSYEGYLKFHREAYYIARWGRFVKREIFIDHPVPNTNYKGCYQDTAHTGVLYSHCNKVGSINNVAYLWDKTLRKEYGSTSTQLYPEMDKYDLSVFGQQAILNILYQGNKSTKDKILICLRCIQASYLTPLKDNDIKRNDFYFNTYFKIIDILKEYNITVNDLKNIKSLSVTYTVLNAFEKYINTLSKEDAARLKSDCKKDTYKKSKAGNFKLRDLNIYYFDCPTKPGYKAYAISSIDNFKKCKIYDANYNLIYKSNCGIFITDAIDFSTNQIYNIEIYNKYNELEIYSQGEFIKINDKKSDKYDLSLIIPCFNCEKYLDKLLISILVDHFVNDININIIAIDDKSHDDTVNILKQYENKFSNITVVLNEQNIGRNKTRKKGIDLSTTEYITFADNDDYVSFGYYSNMYKEILNNKDIDLVIGDIVCANKDNTRYSRKRVPHSELMTHRDYALCDHINYFKCYMMWNKIFKKDLFKDYVYYLPGCDIDRKGNEDLTQLASVLSKANNIYFLRGAAYVHVSYGHNYQENYYSIWHHWLISALSRTCLVKFSPKEKLDENIYLYCRYLYETNHKNHYILLKIYSYILNKINLKYDILQSLRSFNNKEMYNWIDMVLNTDIKDFYFEELQANINVTEINEFLDF